LRDERLGRLSRYLLTPAVRVKAVAEAPDEEAKLSDDEVRGVFEKHVPGVGELLYRGQPGNHALSFAVSAYTQGFRAFKGSDLDGHLRSLLRLVVHYGHDEKPGAAKYLREVAEAFTDCQAVQARVVESVGLQICGVSLDFVGHLTDLVDRYKATAVKIYAVEQCTKLGGPDEYHDPAHYESRILADTGDRLGLNEALVRQAAHDDHAARRFPKFGPKKLLLATRRLRALFDPDALLKAFAAEASALGEETAKDSLPRTLVDWASERMPGKQHALLDEEACERVVIEDGLALAIFEAAFLGRVFAPAEEAYRGESLCGLFAPDEGTERRAQEAQQEADERERADEEAAERLAKHPPGKIESSDGEEEGEEEDEEDEDEEDEEDEDACEDDASLPKFEVDLGSHWELLGLGLLRQVAKAKSEGRTDVDFNSRGFRYRLDLNSMTQMNLETGKCRKIRLQNGRAS